MVIRQDPDMDLSMSDEPRVSFGQTGWRENRRRQARKIRIRLYLSFVWIYCLAVVGIVTALDVLRDRYPVLDTGWAAGLLAIAAVGAFVSITLPTWVLLRSLRKSTVPWSRST